MITLFTTGKPFKGQAAVAQMNALASWKALDPSVEVLLFGESEGAARVAADLDLVHVPQIGTNQFGTPLISAMFDGAARFGRFDVQAYVNCDIILLDDFLPAVRTVSLERFLVVGQRWNLDLNEQLDFCGNWPAKLRKALRTRGSLHPAGGSDYFVYRRGLLPSIPPFAVGRIGWDNWMIYRCLADRVPVVDATPAITIVHQNHPPYGPVCDMGRQSKTQEEEQNVALMEGPLLALSQTTWRLSPTGLRRKKSLRHRLITLATLPALDPRLARLAPTADIARRVVKVLDARVSSKRWMREYGLPQE